VSPNITINQEDDCEDNFPYYMSIPKFTLLEVEDKELSKLNQFFWDIDWVHILEGKSLDKIVDIIVSNIESAVILTFGPLL